ncbi:unannotated protein [freshwater metagenome]|uniref:Unannotated protein n=1 Tax=freshwater metagenome TaxID=449393 RepID=A0A6J6XMW4_9ZZZZ
MAQGHVGEEIVNAHVVSDRNDEGQRVNHRSDNRGSICEFGGNPMTGLPETDDIGTAEPAQHEGPCSESDAVGSEAPIVQ